MLIFCSINTSNLPSYLNSNSDFTPLYHTTKSEMDLIMKLDNEYFKYSNDRDIRVFSHIAAAPLYSAFNINSIYDGNFIEIFSNKLIHEGIDTKKYSNACYYANEQSLDYIIIDAQYNWQLEESLWSCVEKIMDDGKYRVFKFRSDLWEYNINMKYVERYSKAE